MRNRSSVYPPAVVAYMSYSGLGIVRSLGRRGIPVYALDPEPTRVGMNSRFCISKVCPSIESDERAHVRYLLELSERLGQKPVLFPTGDNTVLCYAKHESLLKNYYLFTGPTCNIIERLVTKDALFRTAVDCVIPVPDTYIPGSFADVEDISSRISYPCIIKPIRSHSWHQEAIQRMLGSTRKVLLANGRDELLESYRAIAQHDADVIISEVIAGPDSNLYYFVFYVDDEHRVLGRFCGRKLRLYPVHFGSASFVSSVDVPELEALSIRFLEKLEYRGLGGIEFKLDARDGHFKLIEFNARFGLWDVLGARCGVDIAYTAYCDALGRKIVQSNHYATGIKWASIHLDAKALLSYWKEGSITVARWLRSFRGVKQWAVFAWDDLKPTFRSVRRFFFSIVKRLASRRAGVKQRRQAE